MIQKVSIDHCKGRYPRELATPWRHNKFKEELITSPADLTYSILKWNTTKGNNCYISVYSFSEIQNDEHNTRILNKLISEGLSPIEHRDLFEDIVNRDSAIIDCYYLDFDDEANPLNAIYEARMVVKMLQDFGIKSRIYWSGNKGIALYIDFEPVQIATQNIKAVVSAFIDYTRNLFQPRPAEHPLKTLCDSPKDGQSRVSRVPNTKHQTSGLYCIPLLEAELWEVNPLEHIKELARQPRGNIDLQAIIAENEKANTQVMHDLTRKIENKVIANKAAQERASAVYQATRPKFFSQEWHKCAGVLHAEEYGQNHPGREPVANGLILAYKQWGKYPIETTKELIKNWITEKCRPSRDFPLINERIEKFYRQSKSYSPCSFLIKYGHCKGSPCSVIRRQGLY